MTNITFGTAANAANTYANSGLLVPADSFGRPINNPLGGANATYRRSTFTNGDNLSGTATAGTVELVGTLIRFSDLGITPAPRFTATR